MPLGAGTVGRVTCVALQPTYAGGDEVGSFRRWKQEEWR